MTAMFMISKCKKQQQKRAYGKRAFVMGAWISRKTGQIDLDSEK
jgi:hypothetical protein